MKTKKCSFGITEKECTEYEANIQEAEKASHDKVEQLQSQKAALLAACKQSLALLKSMGLHEISEPSRTEKIVVDKLQSAIELAGESERDGEAYKNAVEKRQGRHNH